MSIWLYRKNKEGKKELYSATIPFEVLFILFGMFLALIIPNMSKQPQYLKESLFIVVAGFAMFLISKISLFKKGVWNSWGSKQMDKPYNIIYKCGYVLMVVGAIGCLFL